MEDVRPPADPDEERREPYMPPSVTWVEPLGQQAALMMACGKQPGGDGLCYGDPTS